MVFSAKLVLVLAVALFSQGQCASHIRRSTDSATPFDELLQNAMTQLNKVSEEVSKLTGTSPEELKNALETKTREMQSRLQNIVEEVKKQAEAHGSELPEKTRAVFEEAVTHLNQTIDSLKSQTPAAMDEVTAFQQRFAESFKTSMEAVFQESGKLAKAAGDDAGEFHDHMTQFTRNTVTQAMDLLTQFGNEVKAAVNKAASS